VINSWLIKKMPSCLLMYSTLFMFVLLGKNIGRQTATQIHDTKEIKDSGRVVLSFE